MKIINLLVALIISSSTIFSQSLFEYTREKNGQGFAYSIVNGHDDSYIITGVEDGVPIFVKLDSDGNEIWQRNYLDNGNELRTAVGTSDSCLVASCYNDFEKSISLIKLNNYGDSLWTKEYNLTNYTLGVNCIKETNDNGLIITGTQFDDDYHDIFIWKFNSIGDSLWYKTYSGMDNQWGESIVVCSDSSYVISGMKWFNTNDRDRDVFLFKVDSVGTALWDTIFESKYHDYARSVIVNSENEILFGATFNRKPTLSKLSKDGALIWTKNYLEIDEGYINEIIETSNGYAITGYTQGATLFAISTDFQGDTIWEKVLHEAGHSYGESIYESNSHELVVAGIINSAETGGPDYDFYVVSFDSEGRHTVTSVDYSKSESLLAIYPNPVKDILTLDFQGNVKIYSFSILDLSGKVVLIGSSKNINMTLLDNGIYFLKVETEKGIITRKILKSN